jgi:FkbH-like protein
MYQLTWKNKNTYLEQELIALPKSHTSQPSVERVLPLYWEEHCVECAIPSCYQTCQLYKERKDLKCARFAYGIFPNTNTSGLLNFGADITFERWAKLESYWSAAPRMVPTSALIIENNIIQAVEKIAEKISNAVSFLDPKRSVSRLSGWLIERWTRLRIQDSKALYKPDGLLVRFYYPQQALRELQLEILGDAPFYRSNIPVNHGWNEVFIDYAQMNKPFNGIGRIRIWPSDDRPLRLIFTWLDLVSFNKILPADKVKCVCWDLDNTLWDGVIGDDGENGVTPNQKLISMIKEMDNRGILQSVVSKNDFDIAWKKIKSLKLENYFLYPAIHWNPKSESIKKIANELGINVNSFAVIDDSEWERNEIISALPNLRTYDPKNIANILDQDEFIHPITNETKNRRQMYMTEASRKAISVDWGNDINGFLKNCQMEMRIKHPSDEEQKRCMELLQRSNQFNLSGKDYADISFSSLFQINDQECLCISLKDKFGDYGIVMVAVIRHYSDYSCIIDFAMSCRVAKKLIEEAFFKWCAQYTQKLGKKHLNINLSITGRNNPLIESLENFDLEAVNQENNDSVVYKMSLKKEIVSSEIIKISSSI